MPDTPDRLQQRLDNIVSGRSDAAREAPLAAFDAAPKALSLGESPPSRPFSPFVPEDVEMAVELASELMRVTRAAGSGDDGLAAALDAAEDRLAVEHGGLPPGGEQAALAADVTAPGGEALHGLTQHAVKLFVTHDPVARDRLRLRPLERRQPELVLPSAPAEGEAEPPAASEADPAGQPSATPPEDRVSFWREDPLINEHHEHWHLVYPLAGRPTPSGPGTIGDRHGELFAYMHEQMLARYDAERLAVNLQRVAPFSSYRQRIPEGYHPGGLRLWDGASWTLFAPRPAGAAWSDLTAPFDTRPGAKIAAQESFHQRLTEAAKQGTYARLTPPVAVTIDNLGDAEEANTSSVDYHGRNDPRNYRIYGNHHNDGHIHFMAWSNRQPYGVMGTTATAIRDPIFFRWHREVDSVFQSYQDEQEPYGFADGPKVRIRSQDIRLFRVPAGAAVDERALADAVAAGSSPPAGVEQTDELRTEMRRRQVELRDADGNPVTRTIEYLSHEDFLYALQVENLSGAPVDLAVRVFLAPETEVEDRTAWIELDRFTYALEGRGGVVVRRSEDSSVVRKPALKPEDLEPSDEPSPKTEQQPWCDCGWPYTVLLPRGNADGMPFRLYVMLSDGAELSMPAQPGKCTSLSYCGLKDRQYPDTREMGYPFNRPFAKSIADTVAEHDNMDWRTTAIRCVNIPAAPAAISVEMPAIGELLPQEG
jgi:tyrosinase